LNTFISITSRLLPFSENIPSLLSCSTPSAPRVATIAKQIFITAFILDFGYRLARYLWSYVSPPQEPNTPDASSSRNAATEENRIVERLESVLSYKLEAFYNTYIAKFASRLSRIEDPILRANSLSEDTAPRFAATTPAQARRLKELRSGLSYTQEDGYIKLISLLILTEEARLEEKTSIREILQSQRQITLLLERKYTQLASLNTKAVDTTEIDNDIQELRKSQLCLNNHHYSFMEDLQKEIKITILLKRKIARLESRTPVTDPSLNELQSNILMLEQEIENEELILNSLSPFTYTKTREDLSNHINNLLLQACALLKPVHEMPEGIDDLDSEIEDIDALDSEIEDIDDLDSEIEGIDALDSGIKRIEDKDEVDLFHKSYMAGLLKSKLSLLKKQANFS
jgi:hypothetical protein